MADTRTVTRDRVFICSPYRGDTKANRDIALLLCQQAIDKGLAPFAPHLLYPQFLNEADYGGRDAGIQCGLSFLDKCDLLWIYAEKGISAGMRSEIEHASRLGIPADFVKLEEPL